MPRCLLRPIVKALDKVGGEALITADHGNVEQMSDESTGQAAPPTPAASPLIYGQAQ